MNDSTGRSLHALYPRLLGAAWLQVAEPVRCAHGSASSLRGRGCFRIAHGHGRLARLAARLLGLPRPSHAAETRLVITASADGEQWHRTFDERRLDTRQYEAGDRELAERFGVLEFRFRLDVSDGSLLFRQRDVAFRWRAIRVRLPAALAPTVDAREDPAGAHHVRVHVRVRLPGLGPVLTYDGIIGIEDTDA